MVQLRRQDMTKLIQQLVRLEQQPFPVPGLDKALDK
jgi:hypothetical protein